MKESLNDKYYTEFPNDYDLQLWDMEEALYMAQFYKHKHLKVHQIVEDYKRARLEKSIPVEYSLRGIYDKDVKEHAERVWYLAPGELIQSCLNKQGTVFAERINKAEEAARRAEWQYIDPYNFNG